MKKSKVTFLKEKQLKKKALNNYEGFQNEHAQNPIAAKALAFQKTKKDIKPEDLI